MLIASAQGRLNAGSLAPCFGAGFQARRTSQQARARRDFAVFELRPGTLRVASRNISTFASINDADSGANLAELRASMDEAVQREDYAEAARFRDLLRDAEKADPIIDLKHRFEQSIDEEDYETAAELRDQIRDMVPVIEEAIEDNRTGLECGPYSTTVSHGIRVEAWSEYHPKVSVPDLGQWFFRYHIKIHNQKTDGTVVQLKARHWIVTDADGRMDQVRGPGVVGEQPILSPGESFQYTSACPLRTPGGAMQGEYEMHIWDQDVEDWTETIRVAVGRFGLVLVEDDSSVTEDL